MKPVDDQGLQMLEILMNKECDRGELALALGVSRMTAGRLADRMLKSGMIVERERQNGRGRPTKLLCLTPVWRYWILCLDGTRCEALWVRPNGEIVHRITQPYDMGVGIGDPLAELYSRLLFTARLSRNSEEPRAIALLLSGNAAKLPFVSEQADLILRDGGEAPEEICRLLNRIMLEKLISLHVFKE